MPNGYWGKILRVNLSTGDIKVEENDETFYRRYMGGMAMVSYYMVKELEPEIDPLGPENKLFIFPGVATGVPFSGSGRHCVGAKSPLTMAYGKAEGGGHVGAELKHAGFDGIIVEGEAEKPVYLWIHDGECEIRDAGKLWGLPVKETQDAMRAELGDKLIRTSLIGPGGEKMVRFACIINDLKDAHGRTGMGAVMGSKNLKGLAVRGRMQVPVADPDKMKEIARWAATDGVKLAQGLHDWGTGAAMVGGEQTGNLPVCNFRGDWFPKANDIDAKTLGQSPLRLGMDACYACAVRCKKQVKAEGKFFSDPDYGGPEYETLASCGSNLGITTLEPIAMAHHLCHVHSLDTISAGAVVAFAMDCFEHGVLTLKDTGGLDLHFGNAESAVKLIDMIGKREGIGDLLAEGSRIAAQRIGKGAERFAVQEKGVETGMHEPRLKRALGVGYAVAPHGGDHGFGPHDPMFEGPSRAFDEAKALGLLEPMPSSEMSDRKVALAASLHPWVAFRDSAVICSFVPFGYGQYVDIINAVTGWNTTAIELARVGERALNLARVFNVREGLTRADDTLAPRYFEPMVDGALKGVAYKRDELEEAKTTYYTLAGWDPQTGVPTRAKLAELGISWAAEEIARVPATPVR
ncbi:MAG: aldehyde ferredoxin oxidoreductase family protein [Chloroflexi bacterium]|nr:aldehyde ferredoxin oxidoreductase family protein [Chloroflexota bacterium]MCL5026771.1 aldehyde ferredoxin oxidoreductase family protein [Chloroflexota bacterium]